MLDLLRDCREELVRRNPLCNERCDAPQRSLLVREQAECSAGLGV